jgi:hypothetical protein
MKTNKSIAIADPEPGFAHAIAISALELFQKKIRSKAKIK